MANKLLEKIASKLPMAVKKFAKGKTLSKGKKALIYGGAAAVGVAGGAAAAKAVSKKKMQKKAMRLPSDMKDYAKSLIHKARSSGKKPGKPKILEFVMKPAQRGSYGHDILRAKKLAVRATRDDGLRRPAMRKAAKDNE